MIVEDLFPPHSPPTTPALPESKSAPWPGLQVTLLEAPKLLRQNKGLGHEVKVQLAVLLGHPLEVLPHPILPVQVGGHRW